MNRLLPKKLGELQAFAVIGLELYERSSDAVDFAYGEASADIRVALKGQLDWIMPLADQEKAESTVVKLRAMMERYIGSEWDNPVEILEWSGFYFGAAATHWSLVESLLQDDKLRVGFAQQQTERYKAWLDVCLARIQQL